MSINFDGFIGPSYQLDNSYAGIERLVNAFLIGNESQEEGGWKFITQPCPGNQAFGQLPVPAPFNAPSRGLLEIRGKVYGVNGGVVFEMLADGTYVSLGNVIDDGLPVSMVANGNNQVFIASGGNGYVIDSSGVLNHITTADFLGSSYATFQDGYILVLKPNSNQFQISGDDTTPVGDALIWSALNVSVQAGQADLLKAIISSREYVRLLGARRSQVYQNVGNNGIGGFPFQSYNQTFIETGIAAPYSLQDLGNALIWIGEDVRGQRACWLDRAFTPQRVSTFAVERWWQRYTRIDNAIAMSYIWQGHLMYQVTFPNAGLNALGNVISATWIYDVTLSELTGRPIWSERSYLVPGGGLQDAVSIAPGRAEVTHAFCFGKHLVGSNGTDGNPGAIYQMGMGVYTDCGADPISGAQITQPIVIDRISPHLTADNKRVIYNRIEFNLQRGVGLSGGTIPGEDPQILLRWSDDGGQTFGTEYQIPMGTQGNYTVWAYLNRLGYANHGGRVFWVRMTDPVYNSLISASLDLLRLGS